MTKYMVLVNQKYLVPVITDGSACKAEHIILDNLYGIRSALAFDKEGMQTEYFANLFQNCETITFHILEEMCREASAEIAGQICEYREKIKFMNDRIHELKLKLEKLEV